MSRRLLAAVAATALMCGITACADSTEEARTDPPAEVALDTASDGGGEQSVSDGGGEVAADAEADDAAVEAGADIPAPDPDDFAGMDENTPEGAEQAFRYFAAHMIWGYQSGDTEVLKRLYDDKCEGCAKNAEIIEGLAKDGELWTETTLEDDMVTYDLDIDEFDVAVVYGVVVSSHEEPSLEADKRNVPPLYFTYGGGMDWVDDGWVVTDVYLAIDEE